MVVFNGVLKLKVIEAENLKPTDFSTRHQITGLNKDKLATIDPYISVDIDEIHVARTTSRPKTFSPVWNEDFLTDVQNGQNLGLTVFHDAVMPPDDFVANATISFDDLSQKPAAADIWVG